MLDRHNELRHHLRIFVVRTDSPRRVWAKGIRRKGLRYRRRLHKDSSAIASPCVDEDCRTLIQEELVLLRRKLLRRQELRIVPTAEASTASCGPRHRRIRQR